MTTILNKNTVHSNSAGQYYHNYRIIILMWLRTVDRMVISKEQ